MGNVYREFLAVFSEWEGATGAMVCSGQVAAPHPCKTRFANDRSQWRRIEEPANLYAGKIQLVFYAGRRIEVLVEISRKHSKLPEKRARCCGKPLPDKFIFMLLL